jgi:hypothetical protein
LASVRVRKVVDAADMVGVGAPEVGGTATITVAVPACVPGTTVKLWGAVTAPSVTVTYAVVVGD